MLARNLLHFRLPSDEERRSQPEVDATNMLVELGNQYLLIGRYGAAERIFRSVLERMAKRSLSPLDMAIALKGLSTAVKLKGDWAEATRFNRQAEEMLEEPRKSLEALFLKPSVFPPGERNRVRSLGAKVRRLLPIVMWTLIITANLLMTVILFHCVTTV